MRGTHEIHGNWAILNMNEYTVSYPRMTTDCLFRSRRKDLWSAKPVHLDQKVSNPHYAVFRDYHYRQQNFCTACYQCLFNRQYNSFSVKANIYSLCYEPYSTDYLQHKKVIAVYNWLSVHVLYGRLYTLKGVA